MRQHRSVRHLAVPSIAALLIAAVAIPSHAQTATWTTIYHPFLGTSQCHSGTGPVEMRTGIFYPCNVMFAQGWTTTPPASGTTTRPPLTIPGTAAPARTIYGKQPPFDTGAQRNCAADCAGLVGSGLWSYTPPPTKLLVSTRADFQFECLINGVPNSGSRCEDLVKSGEYRYLDATSNPPSTLATAPITTAQTVATNAHMVPSVTTVISTTAALPTPSPPAATGIVEFCVRLDVPGGVLAFRSSPKVSKANILFRLDAGSCGLLIPSTATRSNGFVRFRHRNKAGWVETHRVVALPRDEATEPSNSKLVPSSSVRNAAPITQLPISAAPSMPPPTTRISRAASTTDDILRQAQARLDDSMNRFRAVLLAWGTTDERILFDAWDHSSDWCHFWYQKVVTLDRAWSNSYDHVSYLVSVSDNRTTRQSYEVIKATWQNWCRQNYA